ncbi:hypothetical protein EDC01DRAFT_78608 [Geopyxis carbonaria]|nr:hypothetical protein EDC01DRAFT_78608 [Geopyxis carbonaria]
MSGIPPRTEIPRAVPPKSRTPMYVGLAAATMVGYYFYSAGGDPKVARKAAEHDAASASASVRSNIPGREKELKKGAEETMARVGSTVDQTVEEGKQRISSGVRQLEQAGDQTRHTVLHKIDEADRKIEAEASKAKSGVMGWFGK